MNNHGVLSIVSDKAPTLAGLSKLADTSSKPRDVIVSGMAGSKGLNNIIDMLSFSLASAFLRGLYFLVVSPFAMPTLSPCSSTSITS